MSCDQFKSCRSVIDKASPAAANMYLSPIALCLSEKRFDKLFSLAPPSITSLHYDGSYSCTSHRILGYCRLLHFAYSPAILEFSATSHNAEPCLTTSYRSNSSNTYQFQMLRELQESARHPANPSPLVSIQLAVLHLQVVERLNHMK